MAFVDDRHLAVTPNDGNLLIVALDTKELVDIARASLTRGFDQTECARFNLDPCPTFDEMKAARTDR